MATAAPGSRGGHQGTCCPLGTAISHKHRIFVVQTFQSLCLKVLYIVLSIIQGNIKLLESWRYHLLCSFPWGSSVSVRAGAESKRGASPIPDLITGPAASTNPFSLQVSLPTALTTAHKLISACIFQNQVCGEQMLKMKWRGEGGRKQKPTHTNNSNTVKCLTTCKSFKATNTLVLIPAWIH